MLSQKKNKFYKMGLYVDSGRWQDKVQAPGGRKESKPKFSQQTFCSVNHLQGKNVNVEGNCVCVTGKQGGIRDSYQSHIGKGVSLQ